MATALGWPGFPGALGGLCLATDGTYIYNGTGATGTRAKVVKLDIATMTEVDRWTGRADDYDAISLLIAGGFLYAGLRGAAIGTTVVKIDPATMNEVARWDGGVEGDEEVRGLAFDGVNLYAGLRFFGVGGAPTTGGILKLDPATMAEVNRWVIPFPGFSAFSLGYDGTYLYAGLSTGYICQVDPATMGWVGSWGGGGLYGGISAFAFDGSYIYAASLGSGGAGQPGKVTQIDPAGMGQLGEWTDPGPNGEAVLSLTWLAPFIYAGIEKQPAAVVQIETTGMTETNRWTGEVDEAHASALTQDGTNLYVGLSVEVPPLRFRGNINVDQAIYQHAERMVR